MGQNGQESVEEWGAPGRVSRKIGEKGGQKQNRSAGELKKIGKEEIHSKKKEAN